MISLECPARKQLKRLGEALDKGTASGDLDAIHDIRVATRRLGEWLDLMAAWVGKRKVHRAGKGIRKIRKAFQDVRDLDVLLLSLCQPPAPRHMQGYELAQLEGVLTLHREESLERARCRCRRDRCEKSIRRVEKLCKCFEESASNEPTTLRRQLEHMFRERSLELLSHDPRHIETSDLHGDRIRLKRLRYCAEMIRSLDLGLNEDLMKAFAQMQELLGNWHDHLVAADFITDLARQRDALFGQTTWSASLLEYAGFRLRSAEEERRRVLESWPHLEKVLLEAESGCLHGETSKPDVGAVHAATNH